MKTKSLVNLAAAVLILMNGGAALAQTNSSNNALSLDAIAQEAESGQAPQALIDIEAFIASHPADGAAHLLKADIMYSNKQVWKAFWSN